MRNLNNIFFASESKVRFLQPRFFASTDMDDSLIKIDKLLDESQWAMWKFPVKLTLIANDLFEVVSGDEVCPATADGMKPWKRKDAKAQRIIGTTVGSNVITHMVNCNTAKQMWDKLATVFEAKTETSSLLLNQKFFMMTKEPGEKVVAYIARVEELVQRLRDVNVEIPDETVVCKIIMSISSEFDNFSSAWESTNKDDRTLDNLRSRLVIEEQRLIARGVVETSEAFHARNTGNTQKKKPNNKQRRGKCFKCGKSGHWKKD